MRVRRRATQPRRWVDSGVVFRVCTWWTLPGVSNDRIRSFGGPESPLSPRQSRCCCWASCAGWNCPVAGDWVVELVGLELTTKVLWNMVGVRPTTLVGHLSGLPGGLLFCLIFL